ncbi:MAG: stage V sporulation protein AD [Ruminococcaceae bacterium]|nr:stage V sporulation protein AD [Oscillospiraceae bacterium]
MRAGRSTVIFEKPPAIVASSSTVGKKEGEGPLREDFDYVLSDDTYGEESWEKAESKLQKETVKRLLEKTGMVDREVNYILAGDLLNQCAGANYAMRNFDVPFLGLYGACSTMAESMMIGAMLIGGGVAENAICVTSSHFCSAEKQYRYPLEYGGQRSPTTQWTVTGSGAVLLTNGKGIARIRSVTTGKVIDMGTNDANNMGAAMAPAACDTLLSIFEETKTGPKDYDLILTGDLGVIGSDILRDLMNRKGYDIYENHNDCGMLIFDIKQQDVHSGGSGCGCCGSVFAGHIIKLITEKKINKMILIATGALMNPLAIFQGETIPAIAHGLVIERED